MRGDLRHIKRCKLCGNWTYRTDICRLHLDNEHRIQPRALGTDSRNAAGRHPSGADCIALSTDSSTGTLT